MEHQDWTPVTFHKRTPADVQKQMVPKKKSPNKSVADPAHAHVIADESESFHLETVSPKLRQQILQARLNAKLTQVQLAQRINEQPKTIQEYENGKAIPDNRILQKLSKVLGVVLKKSA
jgi:putative transcription factor